MVAVTSLVFLALAQGILGAKSNRPHILHIVADDFGFHDIGHKNGMVETPTLDSLALGGVQLTDYYTFTVCAPSRASIMTGRYAWGIGYYWVGGDSEAVDTKYQMLPKVLKEQGGYDTAMIGKWHCGAMLKEHTPTYRGFDTYFGYYHAATDSYWYHGGEGGGCPATDLSNNTGESISGAKGQNGTYITKAFTDYAVDRIRRHDASTPLYMYLAHMATHDASGSNGGIQAPRGTVDRYPLIEQDAYKVQAAASTELDWSIGNITDVLKEKGMWDNTVLVFVSDNGGPLGHTINEPLRGGKHTYWEGGVRAEAFVYSELLPKKARGTEWPGLAHTSDWYNTLIEGVAGLTLPSSTGPRAPDGKNLWPALSSGGDSPRSEVIIQVSNNYSLAHGGVHGAVIRVGDYKLIIGNPGDDTLSKYPPASKKTVDFGSTGGTMEKGTDHATSKGVKGSGSGKTYCADAPCLFNVRSDVEEAHDLSGKAEYADMVKDLTARLSAAAAEGPPFADTPGKQSELKAQICSIAQSIGFVEPADCDCAGPPTPPTPPPTPVPAACGKACAKACPLDKFATYDDCVACTRQSSEASAACKPKERKAYCEQAAVLVV